MTDDFWCLSCRLAVLSSNNRSVSALNCWCNWCPAAMSRPPPHCPFTPGRCLLDEASGYYSAFPPWTLGCPRLSSFPWPSRAVSCDTCRLRVWYKLCSLSRLMAGPWNPSKLPLWVCVLSDPARVLTLECYCCSPFGKAVQFWT